MTVLKIIEVIGTSQKGFEDAVKEALQRASKTVRNIRGADVKKMTVKIENNEIKEWRVDLKVAFVVED